MTVVTGTGAGNVAIQGVFQSGLINITEFTDTAIVANGITFTGSGFTYTQGVINGVTVYQPTGGTIAGISSSGQTWSGFSVPLVTAFNDILTPTAFNDLFFSGNDTLTWSGVPMDGFGPALYAGSGNDTINVSNYSSTTAFNSDFIDGGGGNDTLNLSGGLSGALPFGNFVPTANFFARNVETINLAAGANYTFLADYNLVTSGNTLTINGSALGAGNSFDFATNVYNGGSQLTFTGNIVLIGGAGDDYFQGGSGSNVYNGGGGSDTVSFETGPQNGVTVNLSIAGAQSIGGSWGGTATFISIENLEGTEGNDTLTGDSANNVLTGRGGNDTLNGGGGIDTANYLGNESSYTITRSSNGIVTIAGADGTDTLTNVEFARFFDGPVSLTGQVRSDFDGNRKGDVLWQNSDGTAAVWLLNGATLAGGNTVGNPGSASWHAIGTGDFDGDGKADILWQNSDGTPAVWLMNGTTVAGGGIPGGTNPGPAWTVLGAADFDGDGKSDILWRGSDGSIAAWLMNGSTLTGGAVVGTPDAGWSYKGTGDFDGDGKTDILFQNTDGRVAIWLMNGTTFSGGAIVGKPSGTFQVKAAGDFDGDGKSDILFQDATGQVAIWLMNGTTLAGGGLAGTNPGTTWTVKQAEDVNGDGKADILWQAADGSPAAWLMNGTSLTGGGIIGTNPGTSWHIVTG